MVAVWSVSRRWRDSPVCLFVRPTNGSRKRLAVGRGTELELLAIKRAVAELDSLPSDAFISLNVSPTAASSAALDAILARVPGRRTVLELTEHTGVRDYDGLRVCLDRFRERGVRIAVDDAGAGYAGLQHILSLQPDVIKLDITLTRRRPGSGGGR